MESNILSWGRGRGDGLGGLDLCVEEDRVGWVGHARRDGEQGRNEVLAIALELKEL